MVLSDDLEVRLIDLTEQLSETLRSHDEEYLRLTAAGKSSWDAQRMADMTYGTEIARLRTRIFLTKQQIKQGA